MSQTPPALRQSSHPEPPSLTAAGPGRKAGSSGPEYLTVKPIFLQLTFSSPEEWHLDDLSIILRPSGVTDWHLCGVRAAVMSDSEDCVRESAAVVKRNVSDLNTVLWLLLSSPLVSSCLLLSPQFLYSTYLFSSARRRFGVDEKLRREVYDRLMPPFEELFDRVEEHALNILVEAWTMMVNRDTESFQQVTAALH